MKYLLAILSIFLLLQNLSAQNTFKAVVKSDEENPELLGGATAGVINTQISSLADSNGVIVLRDIPNGDQTIEFSYLGYFKKKINVIFPQAANTPVTEVKLLSQTQEVAEVVVSTTRNYQKPEYIPTRVEVVSEDEVEERSHDKPSDVSHVVREQPGVQVQRTSATAGTMSIRLQGLSSRYVQILKDGFPLFGGFANVIGITQIPPLDLRQVEIIKGPSSTLYGGDAIAGVINLVSKEPSDKPVYDVMFNGETSLAFDGGIYASQKIKWFAFSLMGATRYQKEKDWSGFGFSETPRLHRYTLSPQLFFDISKHAKLNIGANYTYENRLGGSMRAIEGTSDSTNNYFEKNISNHFSSNIKFEYDFGAKGKITAKNSFNLFDRNLSLPYYLFQGKQLATASEISYHLSKNKHDVVAGIDFRTDKFTEANDSSPVKRDYSFFTFGAFAQYVFHLDQRTTFEGGIRIDYNSAYVLYPLPHIAMLQKWNNIFSTRLNLGMGYKLPTIFQDESEEARFINVQPISSDVDPELSLGGTLDLKVKLPSFNGFNVSINQLYFLTHIVQPLLADTMTLARCPTGDCTGLYYKNGNGFTQTIGVETGLNLGYRGFNASVVYTLTDGHRKLNDVLSINPLTCKHIVSILASYEIKHFYVGIDCYYYSPVKLSNGSTGKGIWEMGLNVQYAFKYLIIFSNFENIFNIRQTSFGPVVFPTVTAPNTELTYSHPRFAEIYAPLEGRLFNVGFKLRLGAFVKKKGNADEGIERMGKKEGD